MQTSISMDFSIPVLIDIARHPRQGYDFDRREDAFNAKALLARHGLENGSLRLDKRSYDGELVLVGMEVDGSYIQLFQDCAEAIKSIVARKQKTRL